MSLDFLMEIANSVSEDHHFIAVEYPLNVLESNPLCIQDAADQLGLIQLSNRPINALIYTNDMTQASGKEAILYRLCNINSNQDIKIANRFKESLEACILLETQFEQSIKPIVDKNRVTVSRDILRIGQIVMSNFSRLDLYQLEQFFEIHVFPSLQQTIQHISMLDETVSDWCNRYEVVRRFSIH